MFEEAGGGGGLMQADTAQMTSAAMEAGTTAEGLDLMLKNLMDNLSPLLVAWRGSGGTTFQNVRLAVEEEMKTLNRALHSIGEDMGLSSTDYLNADDEVAEAMAAAGGTDGSITRLLDADTTEVQQAVDNGAGMGRISDLMNS